MRQKNRVKKQSKKSISYILLTLFLFFTIAIAVSCGEPRQDPPPPDSGGGSTSDITVTDSALPADNQQIPFGNVTVGFPSDETVTITNDGTANLTIGAIASADPLVISAFSIPTDNCSNQTIAPAGSCTLTVRFLPIAEGTLNDSFDIPSNDPDENPVTVNVSGAGAVIQLSPNISVSPSSIAFGTDDTCDGRLTRTATIRNTGGSSLSITSITTTPISVDFFIQSRTCGASLGAGSSCTVVVGFASTTGAGGKTGTLRIRSNDLDTPTVDVGLSGTYPNRCL